MTNIESPGNQHKVEALLFAASGFMPLEEISKASGINEDLVLDAIQSLKQKYDESHTSLTLLEDGKSWKLSVKDEFLPLMQKVVKTTEFEKPLMETLAVIAWKYPALQCDIVKIRHNKAYDHLAELEQRGFITRSKYGRTRKITLTQKFFDYFDLPSRKQAQEAFREIIPQEVKDRVEETERQIEMSEKIIEEKKDKKEEAKEVDLVDEEGKPQKLEEYDEKEEEEKVEVYEESGEQLETYETTEQPEETSESEEEKEAEEESEEEKETEEEAEEKPSEETEEDKEEPTQEEKEEQKVEERIEEMLHPKKKEAEKEEQK